LFQNDATKGERSRVLLEFVMDELKERRTASFEHLLEVMEMQVDTSNDIVLDRVLKSINMDIKGIVLGVNMTLVETQSPGENLV